MRRTVRHIDPWSVFKIAIIFCLCMYAALLLAGSLLYQAANRSGLIENVENFVVDLGVFDTFAFDGDTIFQAAAIGGFVLSVAWAAGIVLTVVLFNLISDLVGGIRISVIEEETAFQPGDPSPNGPDPVGRSGVV